MFNFIKHILLIFHFRRRGKLRIRKDLKEFRIWKIKKGRTLEIQKNIGETVKELVTPLEEENKYKFNCNAYVEGEPTKGGFYHLRQAREIIPGKKLGNNIRIWPRLRKALHKAGISPINIPGGKYPIHYSDEIVVPDYSSSGAHYFVINRSDIDKYLNMLPLDKNGKARAEKFQKKKVKLETEA